MSGIGAVSGWRRAGTVMVGLSIVVAGACGSSDGSARQTIPAATATALADRADAVGAALAGGNCDQAQAAARSLEADVRALGLDPAVGTEAAQRAQQLVASIQCVSTTTTSTTVTTVPAVVLHGDVRPGKGKKHKGGHDHD